MSRNILFLVTGATPQIITETVYGLSVAQEETWIPDEIYILSTQFGIDQVKSSLFKKGIFQQFLDEYNLPKIKFHEDSLFFITDNDGRKLDDLKTPLDNEYAANSICRIIRDFTKDDDVTLHVSIAGGRKTMGFYAGYALSLYGRDQDSMSHVLVDEVFEQVREFFYPAKNPAEHYVTKTVNNKSIELDAYNAKVWLAKIPFVRIRSLLSKDIIAQTHEFSQVVQLINDSLNPVQVTVNKFSKTIKANSQSCKLSSKEFSFYLWFLQRRCESKLGVSYPSKDIKNDQLSEQETEEFKQVYKDYAAKNININSIVIDHDYFSQALSNIDKKLAATFLPKVYDQLKVQPDENRLYQVNLNNDQIKIIDY
ncbi:CRISPR-associated protein (TIGR02584 family) [Psychrobacter luti]|uniref:CRISPR-associated protein (TIGR02584 family) n=1 Tax=Psychrobacter luti TaxID=198481 RepID=A0A839TDI5_9GAMM|nr:CRISPR-associated ring nuclease Csm6 [Psychrobacter luti]MBB3106124.1 CRISPR-associated protein (TIGR02584 family) [Psychrobacter luti]